MRKKLLVWGLGSLLLISPSFALAQTTDVASQIAALQAQVAQLLAEIAQLKGGEQTSCVDLSHNLTLGSTGSDVSSLQNYLIQKGYLDAQYSTGYYGFLTAQAVGKLQLSLGLVSSANDSAYGIMGPRTRSAIACGTNPQPNPISLTATPTSGSAPLTVVFHTAASNATSIDFGDDPTTIMMLSNTGFQACGSRTSCGHTYSTSGTYTAHVYDINQNVLGTATVIITGSTPSATIDQSSLTATTCFTGVISGCKDAALVTLTGSASGVTSVYVLITSLSSPDPTGTVEAGPTPVAVTNGRWSTGAISGKGGFTPGTYTVSIENGLNGPLLATGTLTITGGSSNSPTATIDQSSLTSTSNNPTITGTAQNVAQLTFKVFSQDMAQYSSGQIASVSSSGAWSISLSYFPTGTYTVEAYKYDPGHGYDFSAGNLLATGTLTVTASTPLPSCTLSASANTVSPGDSLTFSWTAQNTNYTTWQQFSLVSALGLNSGNMGTIGSQTIQVPQENVTLQPTLLAHGQNGHVAPCSVIITIQSSAPSATIDQSSLTQTYGIPFAITGTASGITAATITLQQYGASTSLTPEIVPVANGVWSLPSSATANLSGTYTVTVSAPSGQQLTTGTLIIKG